VSRLAGADLSAPERREAEIMLRNAQLLYRHISDLLDAAKLESGRMLLNWARVDLAHLARAMSSNFELLAAAHHIEYSVSVPDELPAEADSEKLQRVLLNLLSNAFKFTPDSGSIILRISKQDGLALLEIQDSGPGVPVAMREAVFERFRQIEGDARRRYGGTGLGLSIVKDLVELHGGTVSIKDSSSGALFSVSLPLNAPSGTVLGSSVPLDTVIARQTIEELAAHTTTVIPDVADENAPLVLVVEDNADMNEFIAGILRPHYRVASAFDGRQGLDKALALHPDLIIADVMMPVMSGDEMVIALRRQPSMENVPIVMLSAKADDQLRVQLLRQGVQAYIDKPFAGEELLVRIGALVAQRQHTMEELQRSEAALKVAQRLARVGSWTWDIHSNIHFWSEQIYLIYGRDPTLPPALYPEVQQYFTSESWTKLAGAVDLARVEGVSYQCDAEVVRPDGSHRWIIARGEASHAADGSVVELHGTVQDITERKQIEEEIRRLNADLERRVAERTAALTATNHELDAFSYAVSHDLRAPLRAMSGFSQALQEDYGNELQGEAKVFLDQIGLASRKMAELIDGLLALSRSTRGEMQYDKVDISELAARLLDELAQADPARQVTVQVESGLHVYADTRMMEVVMRNLLDNAWKYSSHTAAANIHVYAERQNGQCRFCIADNGAGFNMNYADQLFHPFKRLHHQEEFPGIGIGLTTVQRIVNHHGGTIEARGESGKGAVFCFTLPEMPLVVARS
jgi:PAS domain S-box-containing protein